MLNSLWRIYRPTSWTVSGTLAPKGCWERDNDTTISYSESFLAYQLDYVVQMAGWNGGLESIESNILNLQLVIGVPGVGLEKEVLKQTIAILVYLNSTIVSEYKKPV